MHIFSRVSSYYKTCGTKKQNKKMHLHDMTTFPYQKSYRFSLHQYKLKIRQSLHKRGRDRTIKMTSLNSMTLLFISMLSLSFLSHTTTHAADPVHLTEVCANTTFSPNSIYQSNLNSLLSSLSSNATQNLEFYNTTSGQNTPNPVYGLFLCRGDVTPQLCQECVAAAVKEVTKKCSREKVAVIWYDECMLRYSNRSFFSTVDEKPRFALLNTQNITEQEKFNKLLAKSMNETAAQASNAPIGAKKYGTKEVNISAFQTLYNLVQCTADLSRNDCSTCLQAAIKLLPWCCSGKQGGRVIFPSCSVRYELYPFYRMEIATLPPTPIHPSSHTGSVTGLLTAFSFFSYVIGN